MASIEAIGQEFQIENTHLIKPGVGETTRVLLRRIPWKILIQPGSQEKLKHILLWQRTEVFLSLNMPICLTRAAG